MCMGVFLGTDTGLEEQWEQYQNSTQRHDLQLEGFNQGASFSVIHFCSQLTFSLFISGSLHSSLFAFSVLVGNAIQAGLTVT
jgi:hypothetical protein